MRVSLAVLLAGAAALLTACELPRPFAHKGPVFENALLDLPSGDGVRVVVADGLDPDIADPLRKAAVKALADAGIPASGEAGLVRGYVLTGAVQIEEPENGAPEAARFVWQLTGRDGLAIGAFDKEISGPRSGWLGRDPAMFDLVARDASAQVAALLHDRGSARATVDGATEAAIPAEAAAFYFQGVSGAPGDGNVSLARAMAAILKRAGVPMAESQDTATHILAGTVQTETREPGVSLVSIVWQVSARDGTEVGTVSQRNPVKTAAIAERWGELANIVADAAIDGVLDAFDSAARPPDTGAKSAPPGNAAK